MGRIHKKALHVFAHILPTRTETRFGIAVLVGLVAGTLMVAALCLLGLVIGGCKL